MTPVLFCATKDSSSTALYYKVLLQYYSVLQWTIPVLLCATKTTPVLLQSTAPVLLRATKYYSLSTPVLQSTTPVVALCYKVLIQYYSLLQSTTPVPLRTIKYYSSTPKIPGTAVIVIAIPGTAHPPSTRSARANLRQKPPTNRWRWGMEHLLQWNTWRWWLGFFFQVEDVWGGGRLVGFGWVCLGSFTRQKTAMWSGGKSPFLAIILNISYIWGWWSLPPRSFCIFVFGTIHKLAV